MHNTIIEKIILFLYNQCNISYVQIKKLTYCNKVIYFIRGIIWSLKKNEKK